MIKMRGNVDKFRDEGGYASGRMNSEPVSHVPLHQHQDTRRYDTTRGSATDSSSISPEDVRDIARFYNLIQEALGRLIVGNEQLIEHILTALLSEGHILIEGPPGTAKTTIAKAMAIMTSCEFSRLQSAIDIQPSDIIGVRIFNLESKVFEFKKGPIFTNILMIDEINRLSPKAQSAFIEAMGEQQVTVDGITMELPPFFFVVATQNPHEFEGTFPLLEVQRDRFMFCHKSEYMDAENELKIINRADSGSLEWRHFVEVQAPVLTINDIFRYRAVIDRVFVCDQVKTYIRDIVLATRKHGDVQLGSSSRASLALVKGGKAVAALQGRTYVIPDDIKQLATVTLGHRIILTREAIIGNVTTSQVIKEILENIEVP